MPRIIPLPFQTAKKVLNKWTYEAYANDDIATANTFKTSLKYYDFNPSQNIGCIGIMNTNSLKALILMEKINNKICVWDISCKDDSSGSLLVKALTKTDQKICMMNTVDDRWKIARLYYLDK
tara:strand:+ start:4618 stop:4983 length:366 start_codon:yes stop_codon:yes gene_type:complete